MQHMYQHTRYLRPTIEYPEMSFTSHHHNVLHLYTPWTHHTLLINMQLCTQHQCLHTQYTYTPHHPIHILSYNTAPAQPTHSVRPSPSVTFCRLTRRGVRARRRRSRRFFWPPSSALQETLAFSSSRWQPLLMQWLVLLNPPLNTQTD